MQHYITLEKARNTKRHYENFPVASLLLPKKQRLAATILYQYARECDDIADEGSLGPKARLLKLKPYQEDIKCLEHSKEPETDLFLDINKICNNFNLNTSLISRLMSAFTQDIHKKRYQNMNEVIDYCHMAACPAGEMILTLFGQQNSKNKMYSNHLCIALAMIGMLQDIHEDFLKKRIYIPKEDFKKFGLKENDIKQKKFSPNWQAFKFEWLSRIEDQIAQGSDLQLQLKGRLKIQIKVLIRTSNLLVKRLRNSPNNLFIDAPKLSKFDWGYEFLKALFSQ